MRRSLLTAALTATALIAAVAVAGPFEDGVAAMDRGDYGAAATIFQPLAAQGNAMAQYNLGVLYEKGRGVPQDYQAAIKWYEQASAQGNSTAQRNLGVMFRDGLGVTEDLVRAYMWLNLAAASGAPDAATFRDAVAKRLKPPQIVQAQKLSSGCMQRNLQGCDDPPVPPPKQKPAATPPEGQ